MRGTTSRNLRRFKKLDCSFVVETFADGTGWAKATGKDPRLALTAYLQSSKKWTALRDMVVSGPDASCFLSPK